ncbi:hypothetical protein JMM63_19945, partial [Rhodovulum sulfidophilum]|nr:hypothetical protein [Rhodovulum sulfidophilum]
METMLIVFGSIYGLLVLVGLPALIFAHFGLRSENALLRIRVEDLLKDFEALTREVAALRRGAPLQTSPEPAPEQAAEALSPEAAPPVASPATEPLTAPLARPAEDAPPVEAR